MPQYSYKALDKKKNKTFNSKIEAPNEVALEQILLDSDIILIKAAEIKENIIINTINSVLGQIKDKDLITLFITLEQLQKAGVSLLEALKDLKDFSDNIKLKEIMTGIYEAVKSGDLLSVAFSRYPKYFDNVIVSLVAMGEKTGELDKAFRNIYENMKWNMEIKKKISKAVTGPVASICMLLGITAILLKFVVPKILAFILEQDIEIPGYTQALIKTSDFVQKNFFFIIIVITAIFFGIKILVKSNKNFRIWFNEIKLKIPVLGEIILKIELSRFTKFFGVTFSSGIPVLECIQIANNVVVNSFIKNELEIIKQKVSDGKSITKSISESGCFPFIVIRMFKVGEDSGNIENAMSNIDYFYEAEINDAIEAIVALIKPMIMLVMGGLLSWVIAAVFGPIYGNFANIV